MKAVPALGALYIIASYWFTASTIFANPAVIIARTLTDTFSGINYQNTFPFIIAQIIGGILAFVVFCVIAEDKLPKDVINVRLNAARFSSPKT